jgi:hypothetical protein
MIKSIFQSGKYLQVHNGNPATPNIYTTYSYGGQPEGSQSFAGQVRYSTNSQCLEIFDGTTWKQWYANATNVGLSPEAENIIDWAKQKMIKEQQLQSLMEKHPGLKDAYEKLEIMKVLVTEQEKQNAN